MVTWISASAAALRMVTRIGATALPLEGWKTAARWWRQEGARRNWPSKPQIAGLWNELPWPESVRNLHVALGQTILMSEQAMPFRFHSTGKEESTSRDSREFLFP